MIRGLLICLGAVAVIIVATIFPGETMNSDDVKQYIVDKAYLQKHQERYVRCYNSVNYGTSGLMSVEVQLMGEYMNDPRVTSETLKRAEEKFMERVKGECVKSITDYEATYNKIEAVQKKSESLKVGWQTFVFGGGNQSIPATEILQYSPARVRMTLAFNDYVFTADEVKSFYKEQLGL